MLTKSTIHHQIEMIFKLIAFYDGLGMAKWGNPFTVGQNVHVLSFLKGHLSVQLKALKVSLLSGPIILLLEIYNTETLEP